AGGFTLSVDNLITDWYFGQPRVEATYWFPQGTVQAVNNAHAVFANGQVQDAQSIVFLGNGNGTFGKRHLCPGNGFQSSDTAHYPNLNDNLDCNWDPEAPIQYDVFGYSTSPS